MLSRSVRVLWDQVSTCSVRVSISSFVREVSAIERQDVRLVRREVLGRADAASSCKATVSTRWPYWDWAAVERLGANPIIFIRALMLTIPVFAVSLQLLQTYK